MVIQPLLPHTTIWQVFTEKWGEAMRLLSGIDVRSVWQKCPGGLVTQRSLPHTTIWQVFTEKWVVAMRPLSGIDVR